MVRPSEDAADCSAGPTRRWMSSPDLDLLPLMRRVLHADCEGTIPSLGCPHVVRVRSHAP